VKVRYRKVCMSLKNYIILITCSSYLLILVYKRKVEDLISEYVSRAQVSSDFGHRRN